MNEFRDAPFDRSLECAETRIRSHADDSLIDGKRNTKVARTERINLAPSSMLAR